MNFLHKIRRESDFFSELLQPACAVLHIPWRSLREHTCTCLSCFTRVHVPLVPYLLGTSHCSWGWAHLGGGWGRGSGVQDGCGTLGHSLLDTWNAAETEGRVLISTLSALCQGICAREAKRKRLIPPQHNESVYMHTSVPVMCLLVNCGM